MFNFRLYKVYVKAVRERSKKLRKNSRKLYHKNYFYSNFLFILKQYVLHLFPIKSF